MIILRTIVLASTFLFALSAFAQERIHEYRVALSEDLARLSVEARLSGSVRRLYARDSEAAALTRNLRRCEDGAPLTIQDRSVRLAGESDACVRYEFELDRAPSSRRGTVQVDRRNRLVSPALWLWRPRLGSSDQVRVAFDLPEGFNVSVPWGEEGNLESAYRFGPSPESSNAMTLFGDFSYHEVQVPGATLRVSLLRGPEPAQEQTLLRWLEAAAENVARTYGRFPNPAPQVVVVPVSTSGRWGRSPVPFGRVIRDGGEAVQFFVDPERPLEDFLGDWTATHEFAHLMLPYITSRQKWISEGFASYYQNVLMARAGEYSERRAWQKLHEGFERARREGQISPNRAAASGIWNARMMIYWSGAAIALMADAELRERSGGTESLDSVLGRLQACCLPANEVWQGMELFAQLDSLTDHDVFARLYRDYADSAGMPDMRPLYSELGIEVVNNRVRLQDAAPLADVRRAIMAGTGD